MNYRDDLINRLQRNGLWDQLTKDQQMRFRKLTDEHARQMMVMDDELEMGDKNTVELFGMLSVFEIGVLFRGGLVEHEGGSPGQLSKAGKLLAELLLELRSNGLSAQEVDAGMRRLSPSVIAALTTVYKRQQ